MNQDGSINLTDLGLVQSALNKCSGEPGYDPDADIDGSGCVNMTGYGYALALFNTPSNAVELAWNAENRLVGSCQPEPHKGGAPGCPVLSEARTS